MKIAILGKMGSGKSTSANYLKEKYNFEIHSFGYPVKKFAKEIFNDHSKNRKLIQDFAQKIKEIDPDVWIKYLINNVDLKKNIVIDDLRFPNEYSVLKKNGFKIIKLSISDEFQEIRLKNTYPDNYQLHIERKNDISESYTDTIPFDYLYNVTSNSIEDLHRFLDNIIKINLNIKD